MVVRIKSIFEEFEQDVHKLAFYADIVQESYKRYLSEIDEHIEKHSKLDFHSSKRPVYFDILNKHEKIISDLQVTKTLEQTSDDIFFHFNKQMQWFLVEAYEMYEKFIEKLYALLGYLDHDFWNASDYGEIQLNDIASMDENWFFEKIKNKKDKPHSIINVFEKRFSLLKYFDKSSPHANYLFLMQFISEFRHAIVHKRGFVDRTALKNQLFRQNGINGKELVQQYDEFIDFYFTEYEDKSLINLTTIKYPMLYVKDVPVLPIDYNRRLILTQNILSYAYLLTQLSIKHLEKKQLGN